VKNQILNVKSYQQVVQFAAELVAHDARKQWCSLPRTPWYSLPRNEWYSLTRILHVYGLVKGKATNPHASIVDALASSFSTKDFKNEYQRQRAVLPDNRSITRYLKSLINDELIVRTQKGQFMKK
jgi:hypothetical protein